MDMEHSSKMCMILQHFFCLRSGAMATLPKALAFSAAHRRTIESGLCLNHFEPGLNILKGT